MELSVGTNVAQGGNGGVGGRGGNGGFAATYILQNNINGGGGHLDGNSIIDIICLYSPNACKPNACTPLLT